MGRCHSKFGVPYLSDASLVDASFPLLSIIWIPQETMTDTVAGKAFERGDSLASLCHDY